ncbi:MAG: NAD-dependent epimerase/dehydratase family protein [Bacteroidota bacterium]
MKILVIGGTGFISSILVEFLLERNHSVFLLTRGKSKNKFENDHRVKIFRGDRNDENVLREITAAQNFDVVYDMIAYEPGDSATAYEIFNGRIGRFIHCSTVSVYMISNNVSCPITEDQANSQIMPYFTRNPFGMDYGIKKRECEKYLWNVHNEKLFPVTIIRPPYVCGPGDPAKRDFFWIERILDGGLLLVPGSGDFAMQTLYVEDLARTFADLLDYPVTIGNSYNAASEEIISLNDYLTKLAALLKKKIEIVHIDQNIFDHLQISRSSAGDIFTFNTRRTAVFSIEKIKSAINFKSTPFDVWMQRTIEWFLYKYEGHSVGYENRSAELKIAAGWKNNYSKFYKEFINEK